MDRPRGDGEAQGDLPRSLYDRLLIGLELSDVVAVDGCITKAPCGGQKAGRSPVDRGKGGVERSTAVDAGGIPLGTRVTPANRHDSPLLAETLDAVAEALGGLTERTSVHLDRGYDSQATRERLRERGLLAEISEKGKPAPMSATKRGGSWSARTRGTTPTRSWCGARRGGEGWWTSGWPSRRWSSSSGASSGRAGDATAGKVVLPDGHDLSAQALSLRFNCAGGKGCGRRSVSA